MKKKYVITFALILAFLVLFKIIISSRDKLITILVVQTPTDVNNFDSIKNAYISIFEEEGVPHIWVDYLNLLEMEPHKIHTQHPAIIFPDKISQFLPDDLSGWIDEYINSGGNVLVVYDSGTKNDQMCFRDQAIFALNIGANYILYNELGDNAFIKSSLQFKDKESADYFEIPYGKLSKENTIATYGYAEVDYTVAKISILSESQNSTIFANTILENKEQIPSILLKSLGKGNLLYVNLPIGYLKAFGSDDLIARSILRTFLFKIAQIPHLCNAPENKGGLVINWHIDNSIEIDNLPDMIEKGIINKTIPTSFCITAGDSNNEFGDNLGFDALGKGKETLELISEYGTIGSHGGWAHNWFSKQMENEVLTREMIKKYLMLNNDALYETVDYKIKEYAAPKGVHPQPLLTDILDELGFLNYYYPGDAGSIPNRTFFNGKMVSKKLIAFPVMPFRSLASIGEMKENNISAEEFHKWLISILDVATKYKTTRLFYSHPYDFIGNDDYIEAFLDFLDQAEIRIANNELIVESMTYFSEFINRFLRTNYNFYITKNGLKVILNNAQSLKGITVTIPKNRYQKFISKQFTISENKYYYNYVIKENINEAILIFDNN